jgi:hypothetical protein
MADAQQRTQPLVEMGSQELFARAGLQVMILPVFPSRLARITALSHPARFILPGILQLLPLLKNKQGLQCMSGDRCSSEKHSAGIGTLLLLEVGIASLLLSIFRVMDKCKSYCRKFKKVEKVTADWFPIAPLHY